VKLALAGLVLLVSLVCSATLAAQPGWSPPPFKPLRYEEDYRYLADPTKRRDFWDPVKYIPLGGRADTYLSFGGEWRERFESTENPDFGLEGVKQDDVLLHRFLLSADLHAGPAFRTFVQLGSHFQTGRTDGSQPTDENRLDLQQAFADLAPPIAALEGLTLRGGRQEMSYGSSRLVSVREGPNVRRNFDGARTLYRAGERSLDAFLVRPVEIERGVLDDHGDDDQTFWGAYGVTPVPWVEGLHADLYYLGLERDPSPFAAGIADEHRHTVGTRLWGEAAAFDYNIELIYQLGEFGTQDIRAWGASSDLGVTLAALPWKPRLGLKANIESGDDDPDDDRLGTFNPLFPNNAYFSEAALGAPMNDIDLHPNLSLQPTAGLELTLGWDVFWRQSRRDAVYDSALNPIPGTDTPDDRYVGWLATFDVEWQLSRHVELKANYTHFNVGDTLREAGGDDVDFFMLSAAYRF
jgi:hypothetical protein